MFKKRLFAAVMTVCMATAYMPSVAFATTQDVQTRSSGQIGSDSIPQLIQNIPDFGGTPPESGMFLHICGKWSLDEPFADS